MSKKIKTAKTSFLGLDNGGKTSIIHFLEDKLLKDPEQLKPTVNVDISTQNIALLGLELLHWDYGGQEIYRENYIKSKERLFAESNIIIYVIDIQDKKRYEESVDFLYRLLTALQEIKETLKIIVLFHKYDPFLSVDNMEYIDKKISELQDRIVKLSPFKDISFFKTSIYSPITILRTFSEISIFFSDKPKKIQGLLDIYCRNTFSNGAILFDTRNFILDTNSKQDLLIRALETIAKVYSDGMQELESLGIETLELVSTIKQKKNEGNDEEAANIYIQKLKLDIKLYLVTFSTNPDTKFHAFKQMQELSKSLSNILKE